MTARKPAGQVEIEHQDGIRRVPFVMGGSVLVRSGEWLRWIYSDRPLRVMAHGKDAIYLRAGDYIKLEPWTVSYCKLQFRRLT